MIVLPFLILEVFVRHLHAAPPPPEKTQTYLSKGSHYVYKPYLVQRRNVTADIGAVYTYNSKGFRDEEHAESKPSETVRIFAVGDSFTEGETVAYEDSYLRLLETDLNSRAGKPRVEIIKAGIGGTDAEQQSHLLERESARYEPDFVIVGFNFTDVLSAYYGYAPVVSKDGYLMTKLASQMGPVGTGLYFHSALFRVLFDKFKRFVVFREENPDWHRMYKPDGYYEKGWRRVEADYRRMKIFCDGIHAKFIVLNIPERPNREERYDYAAERLRKWCEANDAIFVDTLPQMYQALE